VKLRIYAIAITLVLIAVLTNPPGEQHYVKLAQLYPWVNESLLREAKLKLWRLSPSTDREAQPPYGFYDSADTPPSLTYASYGVVSFVYPMRPFLRTCGNGRGPLPISIGFLGQVFARRPASGPHEGESAAKQGQAKPFAASLGAQRIINLEPAEASTNSFGIRGMMIDMPPRPKDAIYKLGPLE